MNLDEPKYKRFSVVKEMLEIGNMIKKMDLDYISSFKDKISNDRIFFTGEGFSRIFPAKKTIYDALKNNYRQSFFTENATQALEYQLSSYTIFVSSNSGKTKEGVRLIRKLREKGHPEIIGVVGTSDTPVMNETDNSYVLMGGKEQAVTATKSVIEQALFFDLLFRQINNLPLPDLEKLGDLVTQVLESEIPSNLLSPLINANILYFSGRNNGVAEDLTLKTNEITRKKADLLEGTYAVHGVEEVMEENEAVVIIDPFEEEEEKFTEVLVHGVKMPVVAISSRQTSFPTFVIPKYEDYTNYLELVAGWSLLVEIGIRYGIDIDKTNRARKVGNEWFEQGASNE